MSGPRRRLRYAKAPDNRNSKGLAAEALDGHPPDGSVQCFVVRSRSGRQTKGAASGREKAPASHGAADDAGPFVHAAVVPLVIR